MSTMKEALEEAQKRADDTTAQLQRSIDELSKSVDRVIRQNEALEDELTRARADLTTAAGVLAELGTTIDEACSAEVDARVSTAAVKLRLRYMAGLQEAGQMVVLKADYERLLASLPRSAPGLKVVPGDPSDG